VTAITCETGMGCEVKSQAPNIFQVLNKKRLS